jgi:8-oxo-dGTP pyrophosphatase MutT (NUDIX family)
MNSKESGKVLVFGDSHEGEEYRETISAVVRRSDGKFLLVKWKKFGWISLVVGGIDEGENPFKAAEREVLEETGYKVKAIKTLGCKIESHFFAENKNVWRCRLDQPVLLELVSDVVEDISQEEKNTQEAIWLDAKESLKMMTHPYNLIGVRRYLGLKETINEEELRSL